MSYILIQEFHLQVLYQSHYIAILTSERKCLTIAILITWSELQRLSAKDTSRQRVKLPVLRSGDYNLVSELFVYAFCHLLIFIKINFIQKFFQEYHQSVSLDPDQALQNVGPDLGPSCLHRLSADNTSRQS